MRGTTRIQALSNWLGARSAQVRVAILILGVAAMGTESHGCYEDANSTPRPPVASKVLRVSEAASSKKLTLWSANPVTNATNLPHPLTSTINYPQGTATCPGWEDSAHISPGGRSLYYAYTAIDLTTGVPCGPMPPGQTSSAFDVWEASIEGASWETMRVTSAGTPVNTTSHEFAASVEAGQHWMTFARPEPSPPGNYDLFLATWSATGVVGEWNQQAKLAAPISTACREDNPILHQRRPAEGPSTYFLLFDSTRSPLDQSTCISNQSIFGAQVDPNTATVIGAVDAIQIQSEDGSQSAPLFNAVQAFLSYDGKWLYWLGQTPAFATTTCPANINSGVCSWRARNRTYTVQGTYHPMGPFYRPEIVLVPAPAGSLPSATEEPVTSAGETTMTADEQYVYLVYGTPRADDPTKTDRNIGVMRSLIRADRFETADNFALWPGGQVHLPAGSSFGSVTPGLNGSARAITAAVAGASQKHYLVDETLDDRKNFRASFWVDADAVTVGANDFVYLLTGQDAVGSDVFRVGLAIDNGSKRIRYRIRQDNGTWLTMVSTLTLTGPTRVDVVWRAEQGAYAGWATLATGGISPITFSGDWTSANQALSGIRFGVVTVANLQGPTSTGTVVLDEFDSW